jgi:hypothetical protein
MARNFKFVYTLIILLALFLVVTNSSSKSYLHTIFQFSFTSYTHTIWCHITNNPLFLFYMTEFRRCKNDADCIGYICLRALKAKCISFYCMCV